MYLIDISVSHVHRTEHQAEQTSIIVTIGFALFASMVHPMVVSSDRLLLSYTPFAHQSLYQQAHFQQNEMSFKPAS